MHKYELRGGSKDGGALFLKVQLDAVLKWVIRDVKFEGRVP